MSRPYAIYWSRSHDRYARDDRVVLPLRSSPPSLWPGTFGNLLSESNGPGQGEGGQGG
jgi:hypothetical protein